MARIVAAAFIGTIAVLAVASWDIARGRAPETTSALVADLLQTPENRRCSREADEVVQRHIKPGMSRAEVEALLTGAIVAAPRPWFWTPRAEDSTSGGDSVFSFTRTIRYTAFGNQKVVGEIGFVAGQVTSSRARVICAFG